MNDETTFVLNAGCVNYVVEKVVSATIWRPFLVIMRH